MKKEKYQTLYITFSNGIEGVFTGPAVITEKIMKRDYPITVADIKITIPKELPDGVYFGDLNEA